MKIIKNLFIVRSPLQVINAYEASQYFKTDNNILILINDSTINNTKQMDNLIQRLNVWSEIILVPRQKSKFIQYIKIIKKLNQYRYSKIFFGEFPTFAKIILANLNYDNSYMLDDGASSIVLHKTINNYLDNKKFTLRELRFILFGFKIIIKKRINFFTFFNLEKMRNEQIIKHTFNYTRLLFQNKMIAKDENIYFLGQPLPQENFISNETYCNYINQICSKYYMKKIIYIPHRSEKVPEKIKALSSVNFQILESNMPVELFFLSQDIYPGHVASFFSTALYTLNIMFKDSCIESFIINIDDMIKGQNSVIACNELFNDTSILQTPLRSYQEEK